MSEQKLIRKDVYNKACILAHEIVDVGLHEDARIFIMALEITKQTVQKAFDIPNLDLSWIQD